MVILCLPSPAAQQIPTNWILSEVGVGEVNRMGGCLKRGAGGGIFGCQQWFLAQVELGENLMGRPLGLGPWALKEETR